MAKSETNRVALIGAGPRGTSVLERLLANWAAATNAAATNAAATNPAATNPAATNAAGGTADGTADGTAATARTLHIDVVDPYPAGSGHVWQPGQSRLYLMNTQSFYPTLIPEDPELAPPLAGGSFDRWREARRRDGQGLNDAEKAELATLQSHDFPSRALYGRYLRQTLDELLARLPDGVEVTFHETTAVAARPVGQMFDVELASGATLTVGSVVLALGHIESRLSPEQRSFQRAAEEQGLLYFPPAPPADVDWQLVPDNEPVLVRGMGLNFFDVVGQLTEGRGGKFVEAGVPGAGVLEYRASGREPKIIAASRRGTPYRAKAGLAGYYPSSVTMRYLTEAAMDRFTAAGIQPAFDHDLWPLLHRDALWAYYSTLAASQPAAIRDPAQFLADLEDALQPHAHTTANWESNVGDLVEKHVAASRRLNLRGLAAPLAGRTFASRRELDSVITVYLDDDARRSALGESDPVKMAIGALHTGRAILKSVVADGGITDESWLAGLRGWFESFVEGLASGPPALRSEQLAALARAGVVSFVGPDPKFSVDRTAKVFRAFSPWVRDAPAEARTLIEAMSPANRVGFNVSPLLEQLMADGLVRTKIMMSVEGTPVQTTGLDVEPHPYRPVASNGSVTDGMYVLGLQLSSNQWGTAIAAEARPADGRVFSSGQRTLRDADEIARSILRR